MAHHLIGDFHRQFAKLGRFLRVGFHRRDHEIALERHHVLHGFGGEDRFGGGGIGLEARLAEIHELRVDLLHTAGGGIGGSRESVDHLAGVVHRGHLILKGYSIGLWPGG